MMNMPTDAELLQLAADGSRDALGQIAQRYFGFVFNTALRQVRDRYLAEDVTQAVFVILSSKIRQMNSNTLLHGWFFTTTRYAASNALKTRARRAHHELQAAAMRHEMTSSNENDAIEPLLDEALAGLGETDRGAVLLSYFAGQSWGQVGAALGTTAEAARKRVERAIVRMRRFFARRGVEVSAAALTASMVSQAQALAPAELLKVVTASLLTAPPAGTVAAGIAKGVIHMMIWAKLKLAATFTLVVLAALGGAGAMVLSHVEQNHEATVADDGRSVTLENGMTVELVGVSDFPDADKSWHGDGAPRNRPLLEADGGGSSRVPEPATQVVVRISRTEPDLTGTLGMHCELIQKGPSTVRTLTDGDSVTTSIAFQRQEAQKTADVRVKLATGEWKTTAAREGAEGMTMTGGVAFGEVHDLDGRCAVTVTDSSLDRQAKVVVIDTNGQEHGAIKLAVGYGKQFRQTSVQFPVPVADIERIEFRTRPYNEWVQFKNISLTPGKNDGFKIEQGRTEDK